MERSQTPQEDFSQSLFPEEEEGKALLDQLRRAPCFVVSTALHVGVLMLVVLLWKAPLPKTHAAVITAIPHNEDHSVLKEYPKNKIPADRFIEMDIPPVPEPEDIEHDDPENTTPNEELNATAKGDPDNPNSTADLTGELILDAIGPAGGSGGMHGKRFGAKKRMLKGGPNTPGTDRPTMSALRWLKRHQSPDGSWDVDGFEKHCDPVMGQTCDGHGSVQEGDPGVSGLALLAYLGAGFTHNDGSLFEKTVRKGLYHLRSIQDDEGYFAKEKTSHFFMYGHAIATLAMVEAYALTGDYIFQQPAQLGLDVILQAQNNHPTLDGEKFGWRYFPNDDDNDSSVTGWMVMAIKSAKASGFDIPDKAIAGARAWFDHATDPVYYRAGYQSTGGRSAQPAELRDKFRTTETGTSIAVLSRIFLGESTKSAAVRMGASLLLQDPPIWNEQDGSIDFYYWYYATLAMYQVGGEGWQKWNTYMKEAIVNHQLERQDGCQRGSWDPKVAKWGGRGGRVYATAINCLTLEVYYRYDKVIK